VIALGLVFAGYSSEVWRGAWQSLDRGQLEAAQAIGVRRLTIFRLIELPQLLRLALPGGQPVDQPDQGHRAGVGDRAERPDAHGQRGGGGDQETLPVFAVVCLVYWAICLLCEWGLARLEQRANRGFEREGRAA